MGQQLREHLVACGRWTCVIATWMAAACGIWCHVGQQRAGQLQRVGLVGHWDYMTLQSTSTD